jgi:hypothetical protein
MSSSDIGLFQIYKSVYFLPVRTKHYRDFGVVENISKDTIAMVYRDLTQSVVTISSSTVPKQLLTVQP